MPKQLAIVVIGVLLFAIGFPARAEASPEYARTDLSSLAAIQTYLVSIGVDPASVVVQQGRLNYAGPDCPGADWNCTTATKVVQISQGSSPVANIFDCLPALDAQILGLNECLIVQSSVLNPLETSTTTNSASCDADTTDNPGKTKCTVRQSSKKGNNNVVVRQHITERAGSSQSATESADITQTSESGCNTLRLTQTIDQAITGTDPTQEQEARQSATVNQTANGSGCNSASLDQSLSQDENASATSVTQKQNAASTQKNQDVSIRQETGTGNNTSTFSQNLNQHQAATTSAGGSITQTQGTLLLSGQTGSVLQTIDTMNVGVNSTTPTQIENQKQEATGAIPTQTQIGPQDCCSNQINGTTANVCSLLQQDVQDNGTGGTSQSSVQHGKIGTAVGATCSLHQIYTSNGQTREFTATGMNVDNIHACSGAGEGGPTCTNSSLD